MNTNHSLLKIHINNTVPTALEHLASEFQSRHVILTIRKSHLILHYDLSLHISYINLLACNEQSTVLLHSWKCVETNSNILGETASALPLIQAEENRPSSFSPFAFCLRQCAMLCIVSCNKCLHFKFPMGFSAYNALPRSFSSDSILFHFTYKSAAECEAKIHSKRTQLPSGLQSNAEKILFWQDSHLLPHEELGLMVCCL